MERTLRANGLCRVVVVAAAFPVTIAAATSDFEGGVLDLPWLVVVVVNPDAVPWRQVSSTSSWTTDSRKPPTRRRD
jgi:hypothetical protein